jgi:hypothetical protein
MALIMLFDPSTNLAGVTGSDNTVDSGTQFREVSKSLFSGRFNVYKLEVYSKK